MGLIPLVWYCQKRMAELSRVPWAICKYNIGRMIIYVRKYVISDLHSSSIAYIYSKRAMQDALATPLQTMEHTDRHPILSFISALFWVLCRSSSLLNVKG